MTKGSITNAPRAEETISRPMDWAKNFSSLSFICEKARLGDVKIRKINPRSKEDN